jgi:hypothetical protein
VISRAQWFYVRARRRIGQRTTRKKTKGEQHWNYPIHYHFEQCQPFFEAVKEMIYKSDAKDYECEIMYGRKCRL